MKKMILFTVLFWVTYSISGYSQNESFKNVQTAWQLITNFYVESVDDKELAREAIEGMLKKLDPHSVLIPPEEVSAMNEPLDGNFEGVGIEFAILRDTLTVVATVAGGPSEEVGIMPGDRIIEIDGENVASVGLMNSDVISMLRGEKGTKVDVKVYRRNQGVLPTFTVTRDKIPINSMDASYMVSPTSGYIKLSRFSVTSHDEFLEAIEQLSNEGMENLILDLRGNGGGYLTAALKIADEFIPGGNMLLYTEGSAVPRRQHNSSRNGVFEEGNLLILIDEGSASASEIVAGAVQDWDRGIVLGRRSFGKGLVQRPFSLPDGSEVRLTVANYYTPSGRSIQKPYDDGNDEYYKEILMRVENGEVYSPDSIKIEDDNYYETLINNRPVFGGGGIVPDVFVAADTTGYSTLYRAAVASGLLNRVAMNYVDDNRTELIDTYSDFELFYSDFKIDKDFYNYFLSEAEELDIEYGDDDAEVSKELIKNHIKALIARDIWDTTKYFRVVNPNMPVYREALRILDDENLYSDILK
ncbi:S41 family peptidase [Marinilabiliaceae bacterium ANBcel2]|nr:S41 family peptidase [Marinilabiliaceae bacterium ANBcel2]